MARADLRRRRWSRMGSYPTCAAHARKWVLTLIRRQPTERERVHRLCPELPRIGALVKISTHQILKWRPHVDARDRGQFGVLGDISGTAHGSADVAGSRTALSGAGCAGPARAQGGRREQDRRYRDSPRRAGQPRPQLLSCRSRPDAADPPAPAGRPRRRNGAAARPARRARRRPARPLGVRRRPARPGAAPAHAGRRGPRPDREAPRLCGDGAHRVRRARPRRHVAPPGRLRLGRGPAADRQVPGHLPVRAGRVRAALPRQHDGQPDADAAQVRRPGACRPLFARPRRPGHGRAVAGRDVHDRAGRGLGCRCYRRSGRTPARTARGG